MYIFIKEHGSGGQTYQVSIQTVQAVPGVWVVIWPAALRANKLHDLMFSLTWSLSGWWKQKQFKKSLLEQQQDLICCKDKDATKMWFQLACYTPHDQTGRLGRSATACQWRACCGQNTSAAPAVLPWSQCLEEIWKFQLLQTFLWEDTLPIFSKINKYILKHLTSHSFHFQGEWPWMNYHTVRFLQFVSMFLTVNSIPLILFIYFIIWFVTSNLKCKKTHTDCLELHIM